MEIKQGYISLPKRRAPRTDVKYPFRALKPGDYLDPPFKWGEAHRVKSAVAYYNSHHGTGLTINSFPEGTPGHPYPHLVVGRPEVPLTK